MTNPCNSSVIFKTAQRNIKYAFRLNINCTAIMFNIYYIYVQIQYNLQGLRWL